MPRLITGSKTSGPPEREAMMDAFQHRRRQAAPAYDLLLPERPAKRPAIRFDRKPDISDAEFVTIHPDCSPAPAERSLRSAADRPLAISLPALDAIAGFLRHAENCLQRASPRRFAGIAVALFVATFGLASNVASLVGAGIAANPALSFSHVTLTQRDQNGMHILVLNGIIENGTGLDAAVPPIRADFVAGDRVLASILVEPPTSRLGIGESRGFMARLPHPGGKTPDVRLSFMPSGVSAPRV
jgi:hypothetical protein